MADILPEFESTGSARKGKKSNEIVASKEIHMNPFGYSNLSNQLVIVCQSFGSRKSDIISTSNDVFFWGAFVWQ